MAQIADGLDYAITKGTHAIEHKYGKNEYIQTASQIGTSSVRASESTIKILADVVDGGIEAGAGYLSDDKRKQNIGLDRMKTAGKEIVVGIGQGLAYTLGTGAKTTTSAVKASKYYVKGNHKQAGEEFARTKVYANHLGKVVAVSLLTFGPVKPDNKKDETTL